VVKAGRSSLPQKTAGTENPVRVVVSVRGVVQGVGFRPFVYQLVTRHGLKGWVCNTSEDVRIDIEGEQAAIDRFLVELESTAPPLASIESILTTIEEPVGYERFEILRSVAEEGKYQLVSPDVATCPACLQEVFSPDDRRYRYPFTNCTNCGPRFTIIEDIPYDRPKTTMHHFTMCPECQQEYDNPLDRRFHAQPNACPRCGPSLELVDDRGRAVGAEDMLSETGRLLREGSIVAIKGLGGFLLACDATNEKVVKLLRERKKRPSKPFAVMLTSLEEVEEHCEVSEAEKELLTFHQCPIVLLRWKPGSTVTTAVAPGLRHLGVMLPYTPIHHILMRETGLPLVMTSGNLSEEPIASDNKEALRRLGGIADYFLMHNRDIYSRYDDSVAIVEREELQLVRRARGYAPYPIHLPFRAKQVLACGAELKNTFCLTREDHAFLSQHIGDMENLETLEHFENTIELYERLFRVQPDIIACDMHPEYLSTKHAKELAAESPGLSLVPVQHHHAHIVSCMVDNGLDEPVIGVAFDGTGYGTDGCIWGGEFLLVDYHGFERLGQFQYVPLPGGAAAIKRPYRMAIGYILSTLGRGALQSNLPLIQYVGNQEINIIEKQVSRGINSPLTSSCGRLFDAVSALIGVRGQVDYEAQAAIELEAIADENEGGHYPFDIVRQDGIEIVQFGRLFEAIIEDLDKGCTPEVISARFHNTMSRVVVEMCQRLAGRTGIKRIALSGGVFQNRLLLRLTVAALEETGLSVFTHRQVPANDGGISLGQAVVANFTAEGGIS
jgi:hydrogenase maturation protein HypF